MRTRFAFTRFSRPAMSVKLVLYVLVFLILHSVLFILVMTVANMYYFEGKHFFFEDNKSKDRFELPQTPQKLLELISSKNSEQFVNNQHLYGDTIELAIVVQVHNRPLYLKKLIQSLEATPLINKTLLVFSHDLVEPKINEIIQSINFVKVMQIFYPFSVQTHPDKFPGPDANDCHTEEEVFIRNCTNSDFVDSFGHLRNFSIVQIKHHWWWKANFVFEKIEILKNYEGLVLFLEEDHYLAPDFMHCLEKMAKLSKFYCSQCWFYSLGIHGLIDFDIFFDHVTTMTSVENLGLAFNRTIWNRISKFREYFCKFDDYNWDWSLRHVVSNVIPGENSSMVMLASRAVHIGSCGTHTNQETCNSTEMIQDFEDSQANLFPDSLYFIYESELPMKFQANGGWGDPRDHALCMEM